mgnify:CR=1 FL=1
MIRYKIGFEKTKAAGVLIEERGEHMPTTYTHYRFGKDVLDALPRRIRTAMETNRELFDIGLHGPDILFYYRALIPNSVSGQGYGMHKQMADLFFEKAKKEYGFLPKEKETLALLDHIHFAIKRMKENLVLDNPFETEIRQFYPKEWEIGLYAKKCIKRRFGIEIPDAEVGYIAMHIIASEFQKSRRTVSKTFEVIDLALKYIRDNYLTDVKEDSLAYTRLVTHVKYFAQRYVDNKESMDEDELLDQTIKERFQREVCCIEGLSEMLYRKYGRPVTVSEENYLVLHLRNCVANKE